MPSERARKPAADCKLGGKGETENGRGVIDPPSAADHCENRECIDPVKYAHPERVYNLVFVMKAGHLTQSFTTAPGQTAAL